MCKFYRANLFKFVLVIIAAMGLFSSIGHTQIFGEAARTEFFGGFGIRSFCARINKTSLYVDGKKAEATGAIPRRTISRPAMCSIMMSRQNTEFFRQSIPALHPLANLILEAGIQIPLLQNLNGTQFGTAFHFRTGIRWIVVP